MALAQKQIQQLFHAIVLFSRKNEYVQKSKRGRSALERVRHIARQHIEAKGQNIIKQTLYLDPKRWNVSQNTVSFGLLEQKTSTTLINRAVKVESWEAHKTYASTRGWRGQSQQAFTQEIEVWNPFQWGMAEDLSWLAQIVPRSEPKISKYLPNLFSANVQNLEMIINL